MKQKMMLIFAIILSVFMSGGMVYASTTIKIDEIKVGSSNPSNYMDTTLGNNSSNQNSSSSSNDGDIDIADPDNISEDLSGEVNLEDDESVSVGAGEDSLISTQEVIDYGMNLLDWDSINELEKDLSSAMPNSVTFNFKEEMHKFITGENTLSLHSVLDYIFRSLFSEAGTFIQFGAKFILIVLMCNLLKILSSSFKSKNITTVAFFVCYMIILLSVVQSFRMMISLATDVINQMLHLMLVCVPILLAFMATSGFNLSASTMAPIIIGTLSTMSYIIKIVVMPCIISVVVLEIISTMSEEFKVSKLVGLFYDGLKTCLKLVMGISVALLGLYRLVTPGVDTTVKKAAVKFSSAFIPVVGGAVGGTVDFITQGASLVRNGFSAAVIVWIILMVSIPLLKILSYIIIYKVAAAVIEPLGDKKMANIATKLGKGCNFIMSSVGIVALFCVCAFVIVMTINYNGM